MMLLNEKIVFFVKRMSNLKLSWNGITMVKIIRRVLN